MHILLISMRCCACVRVLVCVNVCCGCERERVRVNKCSIKRDRGNSKRNSPTKRQKVQLSVEIALKIEKIEEKWKKAKESSQLTSAKKRE